MPHASLHMPINPACYIYHDVVQLYWLQKLGIVLAIRRAFLTKIVGSAEFRLDALPSNAYSSELHPGMPVCCRPLAPVKQHSKDHK